MFISIMIMCKWLVFNWHHSVWFINVISTPIVIIKIIVKSYNLVQLNLA